MRHKIGRVKFVNPRHIQFTPTASVTLQYLSIKSGPINLPTYKYYMTCTPARFYMTKLPCQNLQDLRLSKYSRT